MMAGKEWKGGISRKLIDHTAVEKKKLEQDYEPSKHISSNKAASPEDAMTSLKSTTT